MRQSTASGATWPGWCSKRPLGPPIRPHRHCSTASEGSLRRWFGIDCIASKSRASGRIGRPPLPSRAVSSSSRSPSSTCATGTGRGGLCPRTRDGACHPAPCHRPATQAAGRVRGDAGLTRQRSARILDSPGRLSLVGARLFTGRGVRGGRTGSLAHARRRLRRSRGNPPFNASANSVSLLILSVWAPISRPIPRSMTASFDSVASSTTSRSNPEPALLASSDNA